MTTRIRKPPPVLDGCHVISYALLDRTVGFTGHTSLYVGRPGSLKEVKQVPCLAIVKPLRPQLSAEVLLMFCKRGWYVIGVSVHGSPKEAKRQAERYYPGVARKWKPSLYTRGQALAHLRQLFRGEECSFCGRLPIDVLSMIGHRGKARICDICIRECYSILAKEEG